jgi:hypothetical protein
MSTLPQPPSWVTASDLGRFRRDGFVVLHQCFDPAPLAREVANAFADAFADSSAGNVSREAAITFRYLPMMSEHTPVSLALLDHFISAAEQLIGGAVIPVRAKAVEYHGASSWHRDSDLAVASAGFACYLEPLTAATGALRVVPGSHRAREVPTSEDANRRAVAVETVPGDVIVFDEHLLHASHGGLVRRQWRVDYVRRPTADSEGVLVRDYFAAMYSPDWDGGYDIDTYPTYGRHWRRTCRPDHDTLLDALGAYAAAAAEESANLDRRRGR